MEQDENKWLETVYRETFPQVARIIHQRGGTVNDAKDIFHDAVIIYLEKKRDHELDIRLSVKSYLIGISKILWIKKYKSDRRNISIDDLEDGLGIPEDFYTIPKQSKPLLAYLAFAGKKCMQLLQAFYYDQLPTHEIAKKYHYGTSHSASVQKHKCLEKIREQVKQDELYEKTIA
jgi:DNA-directed RNA polymerase specialized sigma24 family protein